MSRGPTAYATYILASALFVASLVIFGSSLSDSSMIRAVEDLRIANIAAVKRVEELSASFTAILGDVDAMKPTLGNTTANTENLTANATAEAPGIEAASGDAIFLSVVRPQKAEFSKLIQEVSTAMNDHFAEIRRKVDFAKKKAQGGSYDEDMADGGDGGETGPTPPPTPDPYAHLDPIEKAKARKEDVKKEFLWSWNAYKKFAWGMDELAPLSQMFRNWSKRNAGLGLTILDAVTTLWVMGLTEEFDKACQWLMHKLSFGKDIRISQFESTIRIVGGLVSAYELSGEKEEYKGLIAKAVDIANRLLWAYNTTTGVPHAAVNLKTHTHSNPSWTGSSVVLSEMGTVQLEFRTLSYHTRDPTYDMKATHIMNIIESFGPDDYLCPTYFSLTALRWTSDHVSLGALGDSFFEYLLKQYLLTGKTEKRYQEMFTKAADAIVAKLIMKSEPSGMLYVAEWKHGGTYPKMDHLACFTGGMFALASVEASPDEERKKKWLEVAEGLAYTCHMMYARQKTGISPEVVHFYGNDFENGAGYYLLRPETMETFFYLWRITKNEKYRTYGWEIFSAVRQWCRVDSGGYAGLKNIGYVPPRKDDLMQSFWMAETLKYTYLLFDDDTNVDLSQWVFNTEAHPMRIRKRDPMEILEAYEKEHGDLPYKPPVLKDVERVETPKMFAARKGVKVVKPPYQGPLGDEPEDTENGFDEDDGTVGDDPEPVETPAPPRVRPPKTQAPIQPPIPSKPPMHHSRPPLPQGKLSSVHKD